MKTGQMGRDYILAKRGRLSRAPWCGGWGHYAILDKRRWNWATVCHVSANDDEFAQAFRIAVDKLKSFEP